MNISVDWEKLVRYVSGESNDEEKKAIQDWIKASPENEQLYNKVQKIWSTYPAKKPASEYQHMWKNIQSKTGIGQDQQKTRKNKPARIIQYQFRRIAAVAAVFIFTLLVPYLLIQNDIIRLTPSQNLALVDVENGETKTVILPDGSTVILDSGTELKYPRKFTESTREVFLSGEGYFQVEHNPQQPFVVRTKSSITRVLGTSFNIRDWNDNGRISLAVTEGRVAFGSSDTPETEAVILTKNQYTEISNDGVVQEPSSIETERFTSWINGTIHLTNASLPEIINQVERWYSLKIEFEDKSILDQAFAIHLTRGSPDDVLLLLSTLTETTYEMEKGVVRFR